MKHQQVSLELSKQLKEAGYKQEGLFWWVGHKWTKKLGGKLYYEIHYQDDIECQDHGQGLAVAPTVAELGERLPQYIKNRGYMLTIVKDDNNKWWIGYPNHKGIGVSDIKWKFEEVKLADALAKMWLYLKKEGLLK